MKPDPKLYPWADRLEPGMTIGSDPGYPVGEYLNLFEERTFPAIDPAVGDLTCYVYDPTRHGMPEELAALTDMTPAKVEQLLGLMVECCSLDTPMGEDGEATKGNGRKCDQFIFHVFSPII